MKANKRVITPLIYLGNKTPLLNAIATALPENIGRTWVVPFCGSLSTLFYFKPERAILTDFNPALMRFWKAVREDVEGVDAKASAFLRRVGNPSDLLPAYMDARTRLNELLLSDRDEDLVEFGALYLFVNRFGYRGLWRVNSSGLCNVPFDHNRVKNGKLPGLGLLSACSSYLNKPGVEIHSEEWRTTLDRAGDSNFLYIDPPYHGVSYDYRETVANAPPFSLRNHFSLATKIKKLIRKKKCSALIHNGPSAFIRNVYTKRDFNLLSIDAKHKVGNGIKLDTRVKEVLIVSKPNQDG